VLGGGFDRALAGRVFAAVQRAAAFGATTAIDDVPSLRRHAHKHRSSRSRPLIDSASTVGVKSSRGGVHVVI
jgi:hypothetical protein